MFFIPLGDRVFDVRMIIFQIITLQLAHYITLGLFILIMDGIFGIVPTIEQFFSYKAMSIFSRIGWATIVAFLLNALTGSLLLFILVQRSQKCLDFTITIYIVHFFVCVFYKSFPLRWEWWVCIILCIIFMILLGEYICYRREIREIPLIQPTNEENLSKSEEGANVNAEITITVAKEKDPSKDI